MPSEIRNRDSRWTEQQVKLAYYLYCQMPFGQLHARNARVIELAKAIGRTPSAVAMKLVNLASLDPDIRESGRSGLTNASSLDRKIWEEFHADWEKLSFECEQIISSLQIHDSEMSYDDGLDYSGETSPTVVQRRIGQNFFRNTILASYQHKCCMSRLSIPQLLVASHIVPWNIDKTQRLNPRNGLCLSAIHDRAFDRGFLTVLPDMTILVSKAIKEKSDDNQLIKELCLLDKRKIELPKRFSPSASLLSWHNEHIFLGD